MNPEIGNLWVLIYGQRCVPPIFYFLWVLVSVESIWVLIIIELMQLLRILMKRIGRPHDVVFVCPRKKLLRVRKFRLFHEIVQSLKILQHVTPARWRGLFMIWR